MKRLIAGAVVMTALVAVYLGFAVVYAQILLRQEELLLKVMGGALLVLPIVGAWGLIVEWRFGVASSRLIRILDDEGALPADEFPTSASGRPLRDVAMEAFPTFEAEVHAKPESWRAWLRLGLAYDACGDRRRARWATRKAIALAKARPADGEPN